MTALCFVGSTSLSHILSCIERHKERLLTVANTNDTAKQQIITSVTSYWVSKPGNGINIIDKLLNYSILTPQSVIEWVCIQHLQGGRTLAHPHIYEMVGRTVDKVSHRLRQIVSARLQRNLAADQVAQLDDSIEKESAVLKNLFAIVEDASRGVAEGSADGLLDGEGNTLSESADSNDRPADEVARLKHWGAKWRRAFTRKLAVEEAWARESLAAGPLPGDMQLDNDAAAAADMTTNGKGGENGAADALEMAS